MMIPPRARTAVSTIAVALSLLAAGCGTAVRTVPPQALPPAGPAQPSAGPEGQPASTDAVLAHMGYTVQVGAFTVLDNARNLSRSLAAAGLDAFYFPDASGFFKVRFGNFASREAAAAEAGKLKAEGHIGEYFIVGPADHAVFRPGPGTAVKPLPPGAGLRDRIVATAESFIGIDYAWGGTTTRSGFDCSGLVLAVYQLNGLAMPRSVRDQFRAGAPIAAGQLKKGDLVFFSGSPGGELTHVGIYAGDGMFIHAPGTGKQVRRESLDAAYYKTHFSGARYYLN